LSDHLDRKEIALIEFLAVRSHRVYLGNAVHGPGVASTRVPEAREIYDDHVPASRRPFALHADELRVDIEDEIVSAVLDQRLEDAGRSPVAQRRRPRTDVLTRFGWR